MEIPYLDKRIALLKVSAQKKELIEYQAIKQALEPKLTKKEFYHLIAKCENGRISEDELAEKLGLKFKEPEIELVEGEYYFVKVSGKWEYLKYGSGDDFSAFEVREKNNHPQWD